MYACCHFSAIPRLWSDGIQGQIAKETHDKAPKALNNLFGKDTPSKEAEIIGRAKILEDAPSLSTSDPSPSRFTEKIDGKRRNNNNAFQWPETACILDAAECLNTLLEGDEDAFVTEKLDGSNLSLHSDMTIASRRTVLATDATPSDLQRLKFAGLSLQNLQQPMAQVSKMEKRFGQLFPFLDPIVMVYGEFIRKGTATSKEDRFGYSERGYLPGHFYAFGIGLRFQQQLDEQDMSKVKKVLEDKEGLSVITMGSDNSQRYCVAILNDAIANIFADYSIKSIPYDRMKLSEVFPSYQESLSAKDSVEGVVISVPSTANLFKWKGHEESFSPERTKRLEALGDTLGAWPRVSQCLLEVAELGLCEQRRERREKILQKKLEKALSSAKSKYPSISDELDSSQRPLEEVVENLRQRLSEEMVEDAGNDEEFLKAIPDFVAKNVKAQSKKFKHM